MELQDLFTGFQSLCPSRDKHIARKTEIFEIVNQFAELCAPSQDTELRRKQVSRVSGWEQLAAYLAVLFVPRVQDVRSGAKGKLERLILFDDCAIWHIRCTCRLYRLLRSLNEICSVLNVAKVTTSLQIVEGELL